MDTLQAQAIALAIIILLIAVAIGLFLLVFYPPTNIRKTQYDLRKITINDIDKMKDGSGFEHYLFVLFTAIGYENTYITQQSRDFGADVIFKDRQGNRTVIQAKRIKEGNSLNMDALQQAYTAQPFYSCTKGLVITSTTNISAGSKKLGTACNINIIDRNDLKKIITFFKKGQYSSIKDIIEREPKKVTYTPKDYITSPNITKAKISSGEYFYKLPVTKKKTG
ncbi:restriction endonuclease [Desertibacillus haloalkaliphilus]|uniref:restriction endonuclease n=1 Tax=Desertibacillus haloalkaliphilus TaxID=1328930 RepID=UPI001C2742C2|nr:restriction endonuclease [Desertibacillus haloalkaliphilus]MBU8905561.1 restriction endonuclease [Desertibacillus haloalkaliphilus]